ncbi:MAG: dihydropteroate synthase [Planctomycetota bacterium]|nr:MAG: dihydropteroate synthase [Planctomycetota bacterium]
MDHTPHVLETPHGSLDFRGRCLVMGILNVTPDSFSDGGRYLDPAAAIAHGQCLVADGADVLDIGGESTRPGSAGVEASEQIRRVEPVIRGLRQAGVGVPISIDTQSSAVAAAAIEAGADIVNDVSGVRHDPLMPELLRRSGLPFVVMHMQGTPATMQQAPHYEDVVAEVAAFFDERAAALEAAGVDCTKMIVDPGIGFGKTTEHNLTLLREIRRFVGRRPVLVGPSRKRFLRETLSVEGGRAASDEDLAAGTVAVAMHIALARVQIIRVHEVQRIARMFRAHCFVGS